MNVIESFTSSLLGQVQAYTPRNLEQIRQIPNLNQIGKSQSTSSTQSLSGNFGKVLGEFVNQVDDKMKAARAERTKILTGESNNLHQAMIASQEANVAFTLMLELRNKLVESYQELMRSQV
ncbi:MAG: flagellar hook-basal body complex protein FliE [Chthoniobacterales bacterium]|nr:flagellar hook-basal body complex protein FliE [Chthoniobacterales bacterium]